MHAFRPLSMIQFGSRMVVSDNSGAQVVECIKVLGGLRRRTASLGDVVTVCVKELDRSRKVSKKGIYRALIIGTRKDVGRPDGSYIKMATNRCLILDRTTEKFVGSRVDGPICKELRADKQKEIKYKQIISFSGGAL
jgi:large subunit ribosomal protein L14